MSNSSKPIFLIGMPAVGKSTLGKQAAEKYNLQFIDLDKYIENLQNKSITTIFSEQGETAFRQIENETLRVVARMQNAIVSTGGGTPCFYDNLQVMLRSGKVIFLDFSLELIIQRLCANSHTRPMFADKDHEEIALKVKNLYQERLAFYLLAHQTVRNEQEFWNAIATVLA